MVDNGTELIIYTVFEFAIFDADKALQYPTIIKPKHPSLIRVTTGFNYNTEHTQAHD